MIAIIDYGAGNVGSIANMLRKTGAETVVSTDRAGIERADKLVLPGVGAFDHGMELLKERNLIPVLRQRVERDRIPILGICLGMQLFAERSEEGRESGIGWIEGESVRLRMPAESPALKVPHMGWNTVTPATQRAAEEGLEPTARFYFVHSYHVVPRREADVAARTTYGVPFVSAVQRENILGVQFHPEKSHRFGLHLLRLFAEGRC